jgi:translin
LRRTTDMVRGVTERTRGDLTLSLRMEAAEQAAAALEDSLRKKQS